MKPRWVPGVRGVSRALEDGLALLHERRQTLLRIVARKELSEHVCLGLEISAVIAGKGAIRQLFHDSNRDRALGCEQPGGLACLVEYRIVNPVDEPDPQRLLGADDPTGED